MGVCVQHAVVLSSHRPQGVHWVGEDTSTGLSLPTRAACSCPSPSGSRAVLGGGLGPRNSQDMGGTPESWGQFSVTGTLEPLEPSPGPSLRAQGPCCRAQPGQHADQWPEHCFLLAKVLGVRTGPRVPWGWDGWRPSLSWLCPMAPGPAAEPSAVGLQPSQAHCQPHLLAPTRASRTATRTQVTQTGAWPPGGAWQPGSPLGRLF